MKILVLNFEYPPLGGGGAPVCKQLSELFARRGHDVEVITMDFKGLPKQENHDGLRITRVPVIRRRQATCETHEMLSYVISAFPGVVSRLSRNDYDVIHVHFVIPTGLLAFLATRFSDVPIIITARGPGFLVDVQLAP